MGTVGRRLEYYPLRSESTRQRDPWPLETLADCGKRSYEHDCALLLQPPNNYGEEITSANIRKLVAACKDLDTFALLGVSAEGSAKAE